MNGEDTVCLANIGRRGRRQRWVIGIVVLALSAGGTVAAAILGIPGTVRVALIVPFFLGFLAVFQAAGGT